MIKLITSTISIFKTCSDVLQACVMGAILTAILTMDIVTRVPALMNHKNSK